MRVLAVSLSLSLLVAVCLSSATSNPHHLVNQASPQSPTSELGVADVLTMFDQFPSTKGISAAVLEGVAEIVVENAKAKAKAVDIDEEVNSPPTKRNITCQTFPPRPKPTNVKDLGPQDVDLVMAMGDSITAAFLAGYNKLTSGIQEYRGLSWSIGGDEGALTFPNLIKHYNPNVEGFATGHTIPGRYGGSHLDGAVSGAIVQNMPAQAEYLVEKLKKDYEGSEEKWKVVTILIGANNLCRLCSDAALDSPETFDRDMRVALDTLYDSVPRLFVNVVPMLNVTQLWVTTHNDAYCNLLHEVLCPCIMKSVIERNLLEHINHEYAKVLGDIEDDYRSRNRTDFAVVVQPFASESIVPHRGAVTDLDCFHPTAETHQDIAVALWRNMLHPKSEKRTTWVQNEEIYCPPSQDTFFATS